jgi:transposase-like protein
MPWLRTNPMDERMRFIVAHVEGLYSMTELCERFGVSRQTGYKWLGRYRGAGVQGAGGAQPCTTPLPAQDRRRHRGGVDRTEEAASPLGSGDASGAVEDGQANPRTARAEHGG